MLSILVKEARLSGEVEVEIECSACPEVNCGHSNSAWDQQCCQKIVNFRIILDSRVWNI